MQIYRKLRKIYFRGFKRDKFQLVERDGLKYLLNYKNSIDRMILVDGGYEKDRIAYFKELATKFGCNIFIDIGANIGLYTINMPQVKSIESVYAFEPSTLNRCQLQANLLLNDLHEITKVLPYAVSDREGETVFLENQGNSTGRSRIKETNIHNLDDKKFKEHILKVHRVDDLIKINDKKIAIKIDVEGHEQKAMVGMKDLMTANQCVLQIEVFPHNILEVERYLSGIGYQLLHVIEDDRYYSNIDHD